MIDPIWFLRNLIVALGEGIAFELGAGDLCLTSAGGVHVAGVGAQVLGHQATGICPPPGLSRCRYFFTFWYTHDNMPLIGHSRFSMPLSCIFVS